MSKPENSSPMDPFSPQQQPDEGYSEDPLNPSLPDKLPASLSARPTPAELSAWLATNPSSIPIDLKKELTLRLLDGLPTSIIADIVERLNPRLYIDFVRYLPAEICLKVLSYLDPVSLINVAQSCRMWYDLALDRKLWERLYHLEGWKVIRSELEASEADVNALSSNGHLHRIHSEEGHTSKVRALSSEGDSDLEMTDGDRTLGASDGASGNSIFGSASSSFSSNHRRGATPFGEIDLESIGKGKSNERSLTASSTDSRGKRKEPGGDVVYSLPPILHAQDPNTLAKSSLWMWDANHSQHRINWKYLYNMRRRLEFNWELGKYTTFQLPHPHHLDEGHTECVYAIQFDPKYLVSGSRDMTIRIWNVQTRRLLRAPLLGHTGSVLCLQFDSDPDEDLIVSGSSDSNVFIWKFSTGELMQKITNAHGESVLNVRFDKRILVTSSKDKTIKIFNRRPLRYGDLGYGTADMFAVAKSVRQPGYEPDLAMELPVKPPFTMIGRLDGHNAAVNAIQVRDRTIVSVSGDRHIKIWDWVDQVCTKTIPAHEKGIACVEYDGRRIVSGSSDYDVCIFDAVTGVRVAQLHGHTYLVRTVQAGFGDLPYSKYEDEAEARAIDAEFFKAQERGEVERTTARRARRQAHAGSSRPSDIQAFGAKVPPDGGGGRKYGRIVSGSYDQKIIIWRRNKEGEWKPAHHLRQEEAASTARTAAAMSARTSRPSASSQTDAPVPPSVRQPSGAQSDHFVPLPTAIPADAIAQRSPAQLMAMIDQVVPLGLYALRVTLVTHPAILLHHGHLQNAIDREISPYVRAQLRNAVADALLSVQNGQAASGGPPVLTSPPSVTQQGGPSSSTGGHAGSASTASGSTSTPTNALNLITSANTTPAHHGSSSSSQSIPPQPPAPTPAQAQLPVQTPLAVGTPTPGPGAPPPRQATHPHIPGDQGPARVFKLQFDARKIVCCSQAPVIVGWDFCNGDKELEEASRFFAPID